MMKYQEIHKYKYRLYERFIIRTPIINKAYKHDLFELRADGILIINPGYLWDGVSGPTWDTLSTMIAGLVHDALYQAIRLKLLVLTFKDIIDVFFHTIMIRDGVWQARAWYFYEAVKKFGKGSCIPGDIHIPDVIVVGER